MNHKADKLVEFYSHRGADNRGRTLSDVRALSYEELDSTHDFIQWLFPLPEPSTANPMAPVMTSSTVASFSETPSIQDEIIQSLCLMLGFLGLSLMASVDRIEVAPNCSFGARAQVWLTRRNHNFLRITRILKFLTIVGYSGHAEALYGCLVSIHGAHSEIIGQETLEYWKNAISHGIDPD